MVTNEHLHGGHRNRMIEKVLNSREAFAEHELLEILLFKYIPRKDTNAIAHKLLRTFGSIEKIFLADPKELQVVEGIGKKVSAELSVLGKIFQLINTEKKQDKKQNWLSFDKSRNEIIKHFNGTFEEKLLVVLLDEKYNKINAVEFDSPDSTSITAQSLDVANAIILHKAKNIIIAHNHPSGNVEPSEIDDLTTQKINILCSIHGVGLLDHVIVSKNKTYSYYHEKRLDYIKEKTQLTKLY